MYFLPITLDEGRRITDICCAIIGVVFGLTMFIIACVMLNKSNLIRANFPTDTKGNICLLDADNNKMYPFLYFSDLQNPL